MTVKTEIGEYLKVKYAAPSGACKCGNCQLVPAEVIRRTIGLIGGLADGLTKAVIVLNDVDRCEKCGCELGGEAAHIETTDKVWCHSCADNVTEATREPRTAAGSLD